MTPRKRAKVEAGYAFVLLVGTLVGALVASSCATSGEVVATELETPRYSIVAEEGAFSVRRFAPYVVASTLVDDVDMEQASRAGFRRLAGYIFGANQGRRSIAMTAPVTSQRTPSPGAPGEHIAMTAPVGTTRDDDGWRITFMMPSRYTLDTLPVPDDKRVTFVQMPSVDRAVVRFSWLTSDERVTEQTNALRAWMKARGLVAEGQPVVARYNDPLTLPWKRTNEIWIDVVTPAQ